MAASAQSFRVADAQQSAIECPRMLARIFAGEEVRTRALPTDDGFVLGHTGNHDFFLPKKTQINPPITPRRMLDGKRLGSSSVLAKK